MYSRKTAGGGRNYRTATNAQQWRLTGRKHRNEKVLVILLHLIKYSVIFLNKQLKTDHKCCKILPNVEPRLQGTWFCGPMIWGSAYNWISICTILLQLYLFLFLALWPNAGHGLLIHEVFLDHTRRHTTVSRTPLDTRSARRDLYLTTHNTHDRHPCHR